MSTSLNPILHMVGYARKKEEKKRVLTAIAACDTERVLVTSLAINFFFHARIMDLYI